MRVEGDFAVRGGIHTVVVAEHQSALRLCPSSRIERVTDAHWRTHQEGLRHLATSARSSACARASSASTTLEAAWQEAVRRGAARQDRRVQAEARQRRHARRHPRGGLRHRARGRRGASLGMRHYDVQLIGGMVLHRGAIAEMKTGEGKTLVATAPLYLNALEGRGVHLITVNDYLATRDAEWMGRIYKFLGLSVGTIVHGQNDREKQLAYRSDITYGTNNEFGFDYLRDNMKDSIERYVQRELHYAIVDEVDSILIDEARTPLIISGPAEASADLYYRVNMIIPSLEEGRRLHPRREGALGHPHRPGRRARREEAQPRQPLRPREHRVAAPRRRRRCARTRSTSATSTTSSRTARSSSSTSTPAARCRGAAGPTACTRRSRPRRTSPSRKRTRRWRRSPSRTCSACTTSSAA